MTRQTKKAAKSAATAGTRKMRSNATKNTRSARAGEATHRNPLPEETTDAAGPEQGATRERAQAASAEAPHAAPDREEERQDGTTVEKLQKELGQMRKQLCQEQSARKEAERRARRKSNKSAPKRTIPRPRGTAGQDFSLIEAMGMEGRKDEYVEIMSDVRHLTIKSDLELDKDYRSQSADMLAAVFRSARRRNPILRQYEHDWATAEFVKQFMRNYRKYDRMKAKGRKRVPGACTGPTAGRVIGHVDADDAVRTTEKENSSPNAGPGPRTLKKRKLAATGRAKGTQFEDAPQSDESAASGGQSDDDCRATPFSDEESRGDSEDGSASNDGHGNEPGESGSDLSDIDENS